MKTDTLGLEHIASAKELKENDKPKYVSDEEVTIRILHEMGALDGNIALARAIVGSTRLSIPPPPRRPVLGGGSTAGLALRTLILS